MTFGGHGHGHAPHLVTLLRTGDRAGVVPTFLREGFGWPEAQIDQVEGSLRWPVFLNHVVAQ